MQERRKLVNLRNEKGQTVLMRAVKKSLKGISYFLIKNQADVRGVDSKGRSVVHYMAKYGYISALFDHIVSL